MTWVITVQTALKALQHSDSSALVSSCKEFQTLLFILLRQWCIIQQICKAKPTNRLKVHLLYWPSMHAEAPPALVSLCMSDAMLNLIIHPAAKGMAAGKKTGEKPLKWKSVKSDCDTLRLCIQDGRLRKCKLKVSQLSIPTTVTDFFLFKIVCVPPDKMRTSFSVINAFVKLPDQSRHHSVTLIKLQWVLSEILQVMDG